MNKQIMKRNNNKKKKKKKNDKQSAKVEYNTPDY